MLKETKIRIPLTLDFEVFLRYYAAISVIRKKNFHSVFLLYAVFQTANVHSHLKIEIATFLVYKYAVAHLLIMRKHNCRPPKKDFIMNVVPLFNQSISESVFI